MNKYNQRQYNLMASRLQLFETGEASLANLIDELRVLLDSLELPDPAWQEKFRGEWWTLEQVYAVSLDSGVAELTAESQQFVKETVQTMKKLLTIQQAETITGQLRYADDATTRAKPTIGVVNKYGQLCDIIVPANRMREIIKPLWGEMVIVTGVHQGEELLLEEIKPLAV